MILYYIYRQHNDDPIKINGFDFDSREYFDAWIKNYSRFSIMKEIPTSCAKRMLPKNYILNTRIDITHLIKAHITIEKH